MGIILGGIINPTQVCLVLPVASDASVTAFDGPLDQHIWWIADREAAAPQVVLGSIPAMHCSAFKITSGIMHSCLGY